ncbi:putative transcriptional regulatory protein [Colletotrichum orbiculare MAFF 240422]|uniref:Transcriptional regulatory protein n=1 Tax=Colletotrichum orbiculare (strain 104-T / ATCC 96160 / CBS 514.97 / LARS 414 / MAFF 240422) TaxID=1213857 RepID=N4VFI1_COLOR|nr:putative transcriptional regulatory protein [Colletotrichum orbiculare MAFF 240422]
MSGTTSHKRKRTGCLGCRARRKKCDEARPVCSACSRKGQECVWPDNWRTPQTTSTFHPQGPSFVVDLSSPAGTPERENAQSTLPMRVVSRSSAASPARRRRKDPSPGISHLPLVTVAGLDDQDDFHFLLQHFMTRSMETMCPDAVDIEMSVSTLVPVIVTDDLVRRSMMAVSSLQYMLGNPASPKANKLFASCYSGALSAMRTRLALAGTPGHDARPDALAAAGILLAMMSVTKGEPFSLHVDFTCHVLIDMPASVRWGIDQKFYRHTLRITMYMLIESSLEEPGGVDTPARLKRQDNMQKLAELLWEADRRAAPAELDRECGLYQTSFITGLLTITHLSRLQEPQSHAFCGETERLAQLAAIEMQILAWQPPAHQEASTTVGKIWSLWRLAFLMLLYESPVNGAFWKPVTRRECFEAFMDELDRIPRDFFGYTAMMWPMFVMGSHAQSPKHRRVVREILTRTCDSLASQAPMVLSGFLNAVWDVPTSLGAERSPVVDVPCVFDIDPQLELC